LSPFTLKAIELWLQTYEAQHDIDSWAELCVAVDTKFSRDMYQNYMKDLLNIRQTGDLHEYYDNFYQAMNRVLVHNDKYDDVFFVMRFIDGLKAELRSAIQLHKPRTVDAAMTLALLQVDVLESANRRYYSKLSKDFTKYSSKQQSNSGILDTAPSDSKTPPTSYTQQKGDDKLAALRAQRRKLGLCMKCGEKWGKQHKCPNQIPLHILEEFLEAVQSPDESPDDNDLGSSDEELLTLSFAATEGIQGKRTMRFQGMVQDSEWLLLVDSGSSTTFTVRQLYKSYHT